MNARGWRRRPGIVVVVALVLGWIYGRAEALEPMPAGHYPAVLICPKLAEDSAGHVRLVGDYPPADGVFTYRCARGGY